MTLEATLRPDVAIEAPRNADWWIRATISALIVVGLALLVRFLDTNVPISFPDVAFVKSIEFPVYAIVVGLHRRRHPAGPPACAISSTPRSGPSSSSRPGSCLLGASINLALIAQAAVPSIIQSIVLITTVFLATWFLAGALGIDTKLRALLAAGVSICGVSAAIAAAGAVTAKKEQLAYVASLVIAFALPSIFIQPWLAQQLGSPRPLLAPGSVDIDTTAAVTAAGSIVGDDALRYRRDR